MLKRLYHIVLVGTSFRTAPLELRERLYRYVSARSLQASLKGRDTDESFALLSTCNRIEIYGCTADVTNTKKRLTDYLTSLEEDLRDSLYSFSDEEAIKQLIR